MATELKSQADVLKLQVPPQGGDAVFFDAHPKDRVTGLTLRVRPSGSRTFNFTYRFNGQQKRVRLGSTETMTLEQARKAARKLRVMLDRDEDPAVAKAAKRAAQGLTFGKVVDEYITACSSKLRARSLESTVFHLKIHWQPLHGVALSGISRQAVAARLREITADNGPMAANRSRSTLSALFAWAIGEGLCEANPVAGTNKNEEKTRERVLTDAELAKIWETVNGGEYGRIVRLLMLTAQRRQEIGDLRWSEINDATISLPSARTKNGMAHDIPLSQLALDILSEQHRIIGRDTVFGGGNDGWRGWSSSKATLDANCDVKGWTLHDLRRTAATRMADLGVLPHVVEAVLNHTSGSKAGVAGVYNRASYAKEKREALELWANHLQVAIAQASGANVTRLDRRA